MVITVSPIQTAEWGAGSSCEKCGHPFFWNFKDMWSKKAVGLRQASALNGSGHKALDGRGGWGHKALNLDDFWRS